MDVRPASRLTFRLVVRVLRVTIASVMPQLGALALDGSRPVVAVPFTGGSRDQWIRRAVALGMDVAELRIDLFPDTRPSSVLREARRFAKIPTLATIRCAQEGGQWVRAERERLALYRVLLSEVDGVDVELSSREILPALTRAVRRARKTLVISFHDFRRTPPYRALVRKLHQAREAGADIVKIATHAQTDSEVADLAKLLVEHPTTPLVVLAMGPVGIKGRILFPALGSLMTFAAFEQSTGPGQLDLAETIRQLAFYYPGFWPRAKRVVRAVRARSPSVRSSRD